MDRGQRLIERGYFPSQLPPCFTTKDFSTHCIGLYGHWISLQPPPNKKGFIPKAPSSKAESFSVARVGHKRRVTGIPNPVAHTYLAVNIAQHWGQLLSHYRQSRLSASRPRFLRNGGRAANIPSMQLLYERKVLLAAGYRFMLRTDISRFFPTIYTHSVPWAIHGKTLAKKNRNITPKFFGNLLDLSLRQQQDEQTFGLPIGPDTSHIIAEAIATAVDLELRRRLKIWPAGFRYVDDYFLFFNKAEDADAALAALTRSLKDFELQINFEKTRACKVIEITDDYWTHQLRSFAISKSGRKQASDINHFFELAKDLAKRNSDESVMTYALRRAASVLIRRENWKFFEAHVCHVAMAYPNCLQVVARILSTYHSNAYPLDTAKLTRLMNALLEDHAPLGHHSEVVWALWMCKELGLKISDSNIDQISEVHSSVCALILLELSDAGLLSKSPKMTYWKQTESTEGLRSDLWLLSYEAGIRGWGSFGNAHIAADPHFSLMMAQNIHFYDTAAKLRPIFQVKADVLEKSKLNLFEFFGLENADELIEFDESDGGYEGGNPEDVFDILDEEDEEPDDLKPHEELDDDPY